MSDKQKKPGVAFWVTVLIFAILVAVSGYVAAYFWMVQPEWPERWSGRDGDVIPALPDYSGKTSPRAGDAKRDQDFWERIFAPVHAIDRNIRPEIWSQDFHLPENAVTHLQ